MSDLNELRSMVIWTESAFERLDILRRNAGFFPQVSIRDMYPEGRDIMIATKLRSAVVAVKAALPAAARV